MKRLVLSLCGFFAAGAVLLGQDLDLQTYAKCTAYATSQEAPPPEAVQTCLGPARQGLPGAQYALGAILLARGEPGKAEEAIGWLEKAVQAGHPPAKHLLAVIYLRSGRQDLEPRGKELLKEAICSGYPPAQEMRSTLVPENGKLDCSGLEPASFDGTWTSSLKWVKASPTSGSNPELRLTISKGQAKVYMRARNEWSEVKPGMFQVRQEDESLIVSCLDSGWDLDGKWIESWTLQLLRLSDREAILNFVRTVNNVHVPATSAVKVLTSVAEGKATRGQ